MQKIWFWVFFAGLIIRLKILSIPPIRLCLWLFFRCGSCLFRKKHNVFIRKALSLHYQFKCSLRQCWIKKGEETRSFPCRNPFTLYSFLFYWLSERYNILESFAGIIGCNKHLCPFLALTQRCSSQDCGIATLSKLHQLADKDLLFGRRRYVV